MDMSIFDRICIVSAKHDDDVSCINVHKKTIVTMMTLIFFVMSIHEGWSSSSVSTDELVVNESAKISGNTKIFANDSNFIDVSTSGISITGISAKPIEKNSTYAVNTGQLYDEQQSRIGATTMKYAGKYYNANDGVTEALGYIDSQVYANTGNITTLQSYFTNGKTNVASTAISDEDGNRISTTYVKQVDTYTKTEIDDLVAKGGSLGVKYDKDTEKTAITLEGSDGTQIRNVASAGTISPTNTNAVNGADLYRATTTELGKQSVIGNVVKNNTVTGDAAFGGGKVVGSADSQNYGGAVAIGQGASVSSRSGSIAIGSGSSVSGINSIAIGTGHTVNGNNAGAFGDPSTIYANDSYSFGNNNTLGSSGATNTNIFAVGNGNNVTGDNTFVLGSNVTTSAKNAVVLGNNSIGVDGAVSVGSPQNRRRIVNIADPIDGTDAANKGYVDTAFSNVSDSMKYLDDRLTKKINQLGATSAALSALHPMGFDDDHKLSVAGGFGAYGDEAAGAVGIFYKPMENLMFNVGGSVGTGNVMGNLGVAYRFGTSCPNRSVSRTQAVESQLQEALSREGRLVQQVDVSQKEIRETKQHMKAHEKKLLEEICALRQREASLTRKLEMLSERVNRLDGFCEK